MNQIDVGEPFPLPPLDSVFGWLAVTMLGLSGALFVAEALGFLPDRVTRWINRNRLSQTLTILQAFGIDVNRVRKRNRAASLDQTPGATVEARVKNMLESFRLSGPITVGRTYRQEGDQFHNLMGATADPANARVIARDLSAKWREVISDPAGAVEDRFDFIATPKSGSPLLGAAFAELMRVPLALHSAEPKFAGEKHEFETVFDCATVPTAGSRALVVDDSSTGGGKVLALVHDLQRLGYRVNDVLVVFEPQMKASVGQNAAERLTPLGLRLHSIVKT